MADASELVEHNLTYLKQQQAEKLQLSNYIAKIFETIDGSAKCISNKDQLIYALNSSDDQLKSALDNAIYVHDGLTLNIDDVSKIPDTPPNRSPKLQRWIEKDTLQERLNAGYNNVIKATKERARYYSEKLNVSPSALANGDNLGTESTIDVHLQSKLLSLYTVVLPTPVLKTLSANCLPIANAFVKSETEETNMIWELSHQKLRKCLQSGSKTTLLNLQDKNMALALQCSKWPQFLDEWLLRKRYHKWPNANTIITVKRSGFLLVPTNQLNTETQWQLDFTVPEKYLMTTLSSTQMQCLLMLHQLIAKFGLAEDIPSKVVVHAVFWMAEQIPATAWPENDQQMSRFVYCMNKLLDFLEEKYLKDSHMPNYFAPQLNTMRAPSFKHDMESEIKEGDTSAKDESMTLKFKRASKDIRSGECFTVYKTSSRLSDYTESLSSTSSILFDNTVKDTFVDLNRLLTVDDDISQTIVTYHNVISRLSKAYGSDLFMSILYDKLGLLYLSRSRASTIECDAQSSAQLAKAYTKQGNTFGLSMHKICQANLHYISKEYGEVINTLKELVNNPSKFVNDLGASNDPFLKCLMRSNFGKSLALSELELKAFDSSIVEPFVSKCSDKGVLFLPCHAIACSLFINSAIKLGRISLAKDCLQKFVSYCYRDSSGSPIEASILLRKQRVTHKLLGVFGRAPVKPKRMVAFELSTHEQSATKGAELHALGSCALMLKDHTTATLAFDLAIIHDPTSADLLPCILANDVVPFDSYSFIECLFFLFIQAPLKCALFLFSVLSHPFDSIISLYNVCLLNTLIIIDDAIPIGGYATGAGLSAVTFIGRMQNAVLTLCDESLKGFVFISLISAQGCMNIIRFGLDTSHLSLIWIKSKLLSLVKKSLVLQTISVRSLTNPVTFLLACRLGVIGLLTYIKHCCNSVVERFLSLKQNAINKVNSSKNHASDIWTLAVTYFDFQQKLFQTGLKGFNALTPLFQSENAMISSK
ncbi:unnamed protein product [Owenia fusiformis]|uniref:Uncharacterized protein n=1 Tax=Owenia fusiformis TaxID=6347 RepID=A0A8S4Q3B0_OWEFU|nr:unnamed protein product [Owenia fusiformis]